jgi:glycosyltransferase involved in cell wall biosynthesis
MARLSIGIPVYNGEAYLAETFESLLSQSFTDVEIVVCDNASVDRTPDICRSYQRMDSRISYFRSDRNIGAAANFNRVFQLSSAPLFHPGADDDLYATAFFEHCVDALDQDPEVVLSYAQTTLIGEQGEALLFDQDRGCYVGSHGDTEGASGDVMRLQPRRIGEARRPERRFREVLWVMGWSLPLSGVVRREALLRTSLYGSYSGADKVLLAELALQGRFHEVQEPLFKKRMHRGCSHYMTASERAAHEGSKERSLPQISMLRDYIRMTFAADLGPLQRLHCMATIAGMGIRRDVWQRLLWPGQRRTRTLVPATPIE